MTLFEQLVLVIQVSDLITYVLLSLVIVTGLIWIIKRQRKIRIIDRIPGPESLPILGNALDLNAQDRPLLQCLNEYCDYTTEGSIVRFWIASQPHIMIFKCEAAEVILGNTKHLNKSRDYDLLQPWLGTGLLTSTGEKWHKRRKMLTPAFHFKVLEEFADIINQQSKVLVKKLAPKAFGQSFDIFPLITLCTLDIILETAMGRKIHAQDLSESEYVKALYKISSLVQQRFLRPWMRPSCLFWLLGYEKQQKKCLNVLHGLAYDTISQRKEQYQQVKKTISKEKEKRLAFLDLLLQCAGIEKLSDEDIREEVDTFMFEGHDTTAAAINWMLYLFATNQEAQRRVDEELNKVFGDSNCSVTMDDLKALKYLECCIKEGLRIFPSVPLISRELKEDIIIDGYNIPANTGLLINIYRIHRDPRHFPDPEEFIPERFLPENCINRHPFAFVPFSAGPRNCIGQKFAQMEEKIILAHILRNFHVDTNVKRENLKILGELILRPKDGNMIILYPRTAEKTLSRVIF